VFDGEGSDIIEQFDMDGSGTLTEAEFCNGLLELEQDIGCGDMDDMLERISTAINEAGIQPRPPKLADPEVIERARAEDLEQTDYLAQLAAKLKAAASSGEQLTFDQFLQLVERVTGEASSKQMEDAAIMLFAMADSDEVTGCP
jgi:Ca2+-binding EF-hand superfamily protein